MNEKSTSKRKRMFASDNPIPRKFRKRVDSGRWFYVTKIFDEGVRGIIGIQRKSNGDFLETPYRYLIRESLDE